MAFFNLRSTCDQPEINPAIRLRSGPPPPSGRWCGIWCGRWYAVDGSVDGAGPPAEPPAEPLRNPCGTRCGAHAEQRADRGCGSLWAVFECGGNAPRPPRTAAERYDAARRLSGRRVRFFGTTRRRPWWALRSEHSPNQNTHHCASPKWTTHSAGNETSSVSSIGP